MQLLLNIPESCVDIDLSEKDRKTIEDVYDLTREDKYEIANIGPGADLLVILTTIATFGLSIWNFPTVLKDGLDNWQWLIKKLKSFIRKKELVSLDQDAAGDHGIPVPNYVDENVSTKVVKIIQSYTGVVNKMVFGGSFRELFKPLTGCLSVPLPSHSIRTHS